MAGYAGPPDRFELYEAAVARVESMDLKGATMPYTSLNGHMTSFLDKEGSAAIRLSQPDRGEFMSEFDSSTPVQYGREMTDFVVVPDSLLEDSEALANWLTRGSDWVRTLKPK